MEKQELLREVFSMRSMPTLHKESIVRCELVQLGSCSWKVSASTDKETEERPLLEDAAKQRSEDRDWEH
jgi:hypothetical protein